MSSFLTIWHRTSGFVKTYFHDFLSIPTFFAQYEIHHKLNINNAVLFIKHIFSFLQLVIFEFWKKVILNRSQGWLYYFFYIYKVIIFT